MARFTGSATHGFPARGSRAWRVHKLVTMAVAPWTKDSWLNHKETSIIVHPSVFDPSFRWIRVRMDLYWCLFVISSALFRSKRNFCGVIRTFKLAIDYSSEVSPPDWFADDQDWVRLIMYWEKTINVFIALSFSPKFILSRVWPIQPLSLHNDVRQFMQSSLKPPFVLDNELHLMNMNNSPWARSSSKKSPTLIQSPFGLRLRGCQILHHEKNLESFMFLCVSAISPLFGRPWMIKFPPPPPPPNPRAPMA